MSTKNSSFVFRLFIVSIVFALLFGAAGVAPAHAGGGPLHVKPAATGTGDCSSWANACTLQTALALASVNNSVWVMTGVYKPTTGTDRSATFQLKSGAIVYGGFAGTETSIGQRDPLANVTILHGDIGAAGSSDNSYHVVTGTTDTTLDGFTITGGNANGASPDNRGGGMYNPAGSNPSLSNIIFLENSANYGGGLYNYSAFSRLMGVTFVRNSATVYGGGLYNYDSSPALTNVTFSDNTATESGGGMLNREDSNPTLTNVTFSGNTATGDGGGLSNLSTSSPIIRNTIFWDNTAPIEAQISNANGSLPSVEDSIVQGGYVGGVNIINANPMLGTLGDYGGFTLTIPLLPGSSAIDALTNGTNGCGTDISTDQRGVARPQRGKCDIGAFEYNYTGTYYTKPAASGMGDCQNWENACPLRNALSTSVSGDSLWVMAGTHKPTAGFSRAATFQLKNGVAVYGGFAGTETSLNQRDPVVNITTLSGNINLFNDSDSYHVVTGASGATLDGFTITAGKATGAYPNDSGGGLYNYESNPTLSNLIFSNNLAVAEGGGIYNNDGDPTLTNVTFSGNSADDGGGMYSQWGSPKLTDVTFNNNTAVSFGGGVYNIESSPTLTNVRFSANSAGWGGGMQNTFSNPMLTNVTFTNNTAYFGGGMRNAQSAPTLLNVTFTSNQVSDAGGGMYNIMGSNPALTNVTFSQNSAETGGGMYNSASAPILTNATFNLNEASSSTGGMLNEDSSPTIRNTILWGNYSPDSLQIKNIGSSAPIVSDSVIQGGYAGGADIITSDPNLGALADNGGYTQTHALLTGSSAIDTGNAAVCPASDQRGVSRPQGAGCDIGAYEYDIKPSPFNKTLPANATTGQTLASTLSWESSADADSYEYCYSSAPGPCTKWNSVGNNTSVTLSGLAPNYTYHWQVRAVNSFGSTEADGGTWWSFTTTAISACTWPTYTPPAAPTFGDVPMDVGHWSWVERLANSTITAGCGAGNYCPFNEVVRAQMAIFLLRGKHCGSSYTPPAVGDSTGFGDVPLSASYAPWVKQLAAEGVTAGCGGSNFCPLQVVNRAQMAIFLLRAKHGATYSPPAVGATTGFGDVPLDASYAAWVKQLAAEGVTAGCGGGNFCPLQNVNRAQMATFLVRAFGLP
jgi:predicted outer membrane repeat protein